MLRARTPVTRRARRPPGHHDVLVDALQPCIEGDTTRVALVGLAIRYRERQVQLPHAPEGGVLAIEPSPENVPSADERHAGSRRRRDRGRRLYLAARADRNAFETIPKRITVTRR